MRPTSLPMACLTMVLLAGCGGAGGGTTPDQTLSGTITTDNFSLPAGETRRVNGDLRIEATGDIDIQGLLRVDEGVSVILVAGDELLMGPMEPSGFVTPSRIGRDTVDTVLAGRSANIRSDQTWPPRSDVNVVSTGADVTIGGSMTVQNSANGTARDQDGEPGGSIYIGGRALLIATDKGIRNPINPPRLTVNANLRAGDGGRGGDDLQGIGLDPLELQPGQGGYGGNIHIEVTNLVFGAGVNLTVGRGGDAGWGGRAFGTSTGLRRSRDGTGYSEAGEAIMLQVRGQASAGTINLNAQQTTGSPTTPLVQGGQPPSFFVAPGRGGPSGTGGDLRISKSFGQGPGLDSQRNPTPSTALVYVEGGRGGASPDKVSLGGSAGRLTATNPDDHARIATIILADAFRGGTGFNGCSENPDTNGTKGGAGGVVTNELAAKLQLKGRALHGGDGGDYGAGAIPPGGEPGKTISGVILGRPGTPGRPCDQVSMLMLLNRDVVVDGVVLGRAGEEVSVSRFRGYSYSPGEQNCPKPHLHGTVYFDDKGPINDPDPTGCGHAHAP